MNRRPATYRAGLDVPLAVLMTGLALVGAPQAAAPQESVTRLTHTGARNGQAMWAPDGTRFAFVSNREDGWEVWVASSRGERVRRVTTAAGPVGWPSWLPDATGLLFYERRPEGYRIMTLHSDSGAATPLSGLPVNSFRPVLSPDGVRLLYDAVDPARGNHDIYVRHMTNDSTLQLTTDPGYDSDARWSPDGASIVFHSDRGAGSFRTQIFLMSADGSGLRQLTYGPSVHAYPAWSPSGNCIVFTSQTDDNRDVWLMDRNGRAPRRLTHHPGFDGDPVWHPNGAQVLFSTDRFDGQELALLDLTDDDIRRCDR